MAFLSQEKVKELVAETASSSSGRYFNVAKIDNGSEVRLRIMDMDGVTGYEAWNVDNKPVRFEQKPVEIPENIKTDDSGQKQIKAFLAAIVYDYSDGMFKCMSITQKSIKESLLKFIADDDYGDPSGYDIKIGRTGEKLLTSYTLIPSPPKALSEKLAKEWHEQKDKCNLNALFSGEEVFS